LVPAGLFAVDLFLFIRKKIKLIFLRSYILAALIFSPLAVLVLIFRKADLSKNWPPIPKTEYIFSYFKNLLDGSDLKLLLFAFGSTTILAYFFIQIVKKHNINWRYNVLMSMLWTIVFMIGTMFIYSSRINPSGSVWVLRYFYVLLPAIFLISAFGTSLLINFLARKNKAAKIAALIFLALVVFFNVLSIAAMPRPNVLYPAIAEKLAAQEDIYAQRTAVIGQHSREKREIFHGWNEYYVSKQGQRRKVQYADMDKIRAGAYKKVYVFSGHVKIKEDKKLFAKYNLVQKDNELQIMTYERKD
jgi:MFS family permease